jgi:hypothetical protein
MLRPGRSGKAKKTQNDECDVTEKMEALRARRSSLQGAVCRGPASNVAGRTSACRKSDSPQLAAGNEAQANRAGNQ